MKRVGAGLITYCEGTKGTINSQSMRLGIRGASSSNYCGSRYSLYTCIDNEFPYRETMKERQREKERMSVL